MTTPESHATNTAGPDTPSAGEGETLATGGLGRILRRWLTRLLIVFAVLILVIMLAIGGLLAALNSDTGTAWVLEKIPGLEMEEAQGSLLGEWQADRLRWSGYGINLAVEAPYLDWSPTCLLRQRLCLDTLHARAIDLRVQPGDTDDSAGPIELPTISLPLSITVRDVELGTFDLNGGRIWQSLRLQAEGGGADWHLQTLEVVREDLDVAVSGRIETRGDWPLALDVAANLPPPYGDRWRVAGTLGGSVRDLRLALSSEGYLNASLDGRLEPLDPALPARLRLSSPEFLALDTLPPTLTLQDLQLNLEGNLDRGYRLVTRAGLPGEPDTIALALDGRITAEQLDRIQLTLTGPAAVSSAAGAADSEAGDTETEGELSFTGQVSWADGVQAEGDIALDRFPWYSLLPDLDAPPVIVSELTASGRFVDNRYEASLSVAVQGPQGDARLDTSLAGDLEQVSLTGLEVSTGAGRLTGDAQVLFAGPLSWQADLELDDFNPGYWVPEAEASISGDLRSEGQLNDGVPALWLAWDLSGERRSEPLSSKGRLSSEQNRLEVTELEATLGENEVSGTGFWDGSFGADLMLSVPEPEVIVPGLTGSLEGTASVSGTLDEPLGELRLKAAELQWQDQVRIGTVSLRADLGAGRRLDSELQVTDIVSAEQRIESLTATLSGTPEQHQLALAVEHREVTADLGFSGRWQQNAGGEGVAGWLGQLAEGVVEITGPGQRWELDQAAAIRFLPDQELTLASHCWRWDQSALCSGNQTLLPELAVSVTLERFPTMALDPLLPETLRWEAMLNGELNVVMTDNGPQGQIRVGAGPGEVSVVTESDWESLNYDVLDLTMDLNPTEALASLLLSGDGIGELALDFALNPNDEGLPAQGTFELRGFDMALVGGLLDLEEVVGSINGEGRLEGPLMNPEVFGQLRLENGRVIDQAIPLPMEELDILLEFAGRRATLEGTWSSNGTGQGNVGGELDWTGTPALSLSLGGEGLPVTYDPYARLELSPDLTLTFSEGDLSVSGRVDIPRGDITIRQLPEQAVAVSDDEVIVGVAAEEPVVRSFAMDVQVNVGSERVTFSGFGVTGDLEGGLRVGNDMDTRGALQLTDGRYAAFGQELELRRARLVFVGPVSEPYLDIEAIRRVDEVVAGIRLSGPVSEPRTEVFSEPSMSQNEALSYVILGRPLQGQSDDGQMQRAALSLGLTQASRITRGLGEEFGIRDLTLEAEGSGEDSAVVASGYLTDDLSIRYGVGLFEPITTVALRYDLGRYFYIEAASGLASSLDIFYTRNF